MSDTENPPVDPADPPSNQGGGSNATELDGSGSDPEGTDSARAADPPTTQSGGG